MSLHDTDLDIRKHNIRDEARQYFADRLTYADLNKPNWRQLIVILEKHIQRHNEKELKKPEYDRNYIMEIGKCVFRKGTKAITKRAYINVKLDNYTEREGISFNPTEFIGFCGWAGNYNLQVFVDAFKEWVDYIYEQKQQFISAAMEITLLFEKLFPAICIKKSVVEKIIQQKLDELYPKASAKKIQGTVQPLNKAYIVSQMAGIPTLNFEYKPNIDELMNLEIEDTTLGRLYTNSEYDNLLDFIFDKIIVEDTLSYNILQAINEQFAT